MACDPSVDVQKLSQLLDLQERMLARRAEQEFNEAYTQMVSKMPRIRKNKDVVIKGTKQYSYATWDSIFEVVSPILEEHGFSLSFDSQPRPGGEGGLMITGTLLHKAGHKRSASIPLALENSGSKNNVQGMGSTFSYGRRYTAVMLLNLVVVDDDDDGIAGGTRFITAAHKDELVELIKATRTDTVRFLYQFEVNSLDELEEAHFIPAKNLLLQKKAALQRKTGGDPA
jgi:hypothetical protein